MGAMESGLIGVVGLGFLGRGIAASLLAHGFEVIGFTTGADTHERARSYIATAMDELVVRAGLAQDIAGSWPRRFREAHSPAEFGGCEFVIESVVEDLGVKRRVFDQIEAVVGADVPIASNT